MKTKRIIPEKWNLKMYGNKTLVVEDDAGSEICELNEGIRFPEKCKIANVIAVLPDLLSLAQELATIDDLVDVIPLRNYAKTILREAGVE